LNRLTRKESTNAQHRATARIELYGHVDAQMRACWNTLGIEEATALSEVDITSTAAWCDALYATRLQERDCEVVKWIDGAALIGVFPFFHSREFVRGIPCRRLSCISELYSGRNRLLSPVPESFAQALLDCLADQARPWDQLMLTLMEGSSSMRALEAAARQRGFHIQVVGTSESPWISLPTSWDTYLASLPKKFRWLLRQCRKKMQEVGVVQYRHFSAPVEVAELLKCVGEIERGSWKEQSGSSITLNQHQMDFYRAFAAAAAANGWLSGHVLYVDQEPVAYILGASVGHVFHDLKESYKLSFRDFSAGHVLKTFAIPQLIGGGIQLYDFRGKCEEYKMKWTQDTYRRASVAVYSNTFRARCIRYAGQLNASLRSHSLAKK
jgi:CelD/BcsL family acetyltransferase involved in cellulose biosynthesis